VKLTAVRDKLDPVLAAAGFVRSRQAWNRRVDRHTIDVVTLQLTAARWHVWVNLGVADLDVFATCLAMEPPETLTEMHCTARSRLGQLVDGRDSSWMLDDPETANDIARKMETVGLPFMDQMHDRRAMLADLKEKPPEWPTIAFRAALEFKLGNQRDACASLEVFRSRLAKRPNASPEFYRRIDELHERWACPDS